MTEIGARGLTACLDEAFEIALDDCDAVFLSVDIDVCDPSHAPGTGYWYLVRRGGCIQSSWQSSLGAEPGRDATLP